MSHNLKKQIVWLQYRKFQDAETWRDIQTRFISVYSTQSVSSDDITAYMFYLFITDLA